MHIGDDFTKVSRKAGDLSAERLSQEVQMLLDLLRRYSTELGFYQYAFGLTPEGANEVTDRIGTAVRPLSTQALETYLAAIDGKVIDLFCPLLLQYDTQIEQRNQQLEAVKLQVVRLEGQVGEFREKLSAMEALNQSLSEELLGLYQKGLVDPSAGATFQELEKNSVKQYIQTIEKENAEIKEEFSVVLDKVGLLEANLKIQTEMALDSQRKVDEYLAQIRALTSQQLQAEEKISALDEEAFERESELKQTKAKLGAKAAEAEALAATLDQARAEFNQKLRKVQEETGSRENWSEKVEKKDLLLEVQTLKALNTDLNSKLTTALAIQFRLEKENGELSRRSEGLASLAAELDRKSDETLKINSRMNENLALYNQIDQAGKDPSQAVSDLKSRFKAEIDGIFSAKATEIAALKEESRLRTEKLKAANAREISEFKRQLAYLQNDNLALRHNLDELKAHVHSKDAQQTLEEAIKRVVAQKDAVIESLHDEIRGLHTQVTELKLKNLSDRRG